MIAPHEPTEPGCPYRAETPAPEIEARITEDSRRALPRSSPPACPSLLDSSGHAGGRALRPELVAIIPDRMRSRPIDRRGYSVPWFVEYINGEPDFRVMDRAKHLRALKFRLCWLCGEKLGKRVTFVIGPMCVVNRTTAEPACHHDCAEYAAKGCPFLTLPHAKYRTANLPADGYPTPGALMHNPTAMALYTCREWRAQIVHDEQGRAGIILRLGEPDAVVYWHKGRHATRAEVQDALAIGLPKLREIAESEGAEALAAFGEYVVRAERYLPAP